MVQLTTQRLQIVPDTGWPQGGIGEPVADNLQLIA